MAEYTPSTPDPSLRVLVETAVRSVLLLLGSIGLWHGAASDSLISLIAGAVIAVGSLVWSLVEKYQAAHRDHVGSVESARTGTAVRVL